MRATCSPRHEEYVGVFIVYPCRFLLHRRGICRTDARDGPRDSQVALRSAEMRHAGPELVPRRRGGYITPPRTLSRRRVIMRGSRCRGGTSTRNEIARTRPYPRLETSRLAALIEFFNVNEGDKDRLK